MGVADDKLDDLAITDPYKAVAIDVEALRANPNLPGGFTVTGLVYDVKTGRIETVVPPSRCGPNRVKVIRYDEGAAMRHRTRKAE